MHLFELPQSQARKHSECETLRGFDGPKEFGDLVMPMQPDTIDVLTVDRAAVHHMEVTIPLRTLRHLLHPAGGHVRY